MADNLARRVLGPGGTDPGCEGALERLDEFVELELAQRVPAGPLVEVARHLEACPDCREDYEGLRELAGSSGPG